MVKFKCTAQANVRSTQPVSPFCFKTWEDWSNPPRLPKHIFQAIKRNANTKVRKVAERKFPDFNKNFRPEFGTEKFRFFHLFCEDFPLFFSGKQRPQKIH